MGGTSLKINTLEALRRVRRISDRIGDPRPALKNIGEYMARVTDDRFFAQKDPDGNAWPDLAPATWLKKKNRKILTESTDMRGSIKPTVFKVMVRISTDKPYAAIHQFGGEVKKQVAVRRHWRFMDKAFGESIPDRHVLVKAHSRKMNLKIKKRRFLGVNDSDLREFDAIVEDHVLEGAGGS